MASISLVENQHRIPLLFPTGTMIMQNPTLAITKKETKILMLVLKRAMNQSRKRRNTAPVNQERRTNYCALRICPRGSKMSEVSARCISTRILRKAWRSTEKMKALRVKMKWQLMETKAAIKRVDKRKRVERATRKGKKRVETKIVLKMKAKPRVIIAGIV